jgi:pimeloyl-ACP methyl ester carboxylesterase
MKDVAVAPDGVPVCFEAEGGGTPAIVFVHGWSCDRRYWRDQLSHFAERHRVVAVDLGGHGKSGTDREEWTMPAFGDDVVAVVEKLDLDSVVLVGHSMGGDVIVETALRIPDRVEALVWVDTYTRLGPVRDAEQTGDFMEPFHCDFVAATRDLVHRLSVPASDPDLVEWIAADMSSAPPEIAIDALWHAITNDDAILAGLGELTVPFYAINPDSRPTDAESLRRHGVEPVVMSGVGHFLMMEEPDAFNRLLGELIERL